MKKLLKAFTLTAVALTLGACGANEGTEDTDTTAKVEDTTAQTEPTEMETMKVGFMPNYASLNSVVAGMQTDAFKDEGIEVELVEFADGPTIIAAMESGSIDVGYIGPGAHVLPIQGNADIFAFSHLGNGDEVIANTEKGIESIEDLKGKKIGVAPGTSSESILQMTLEEAGLTEADVEIVNMDASAIVTAMISGSVDAAATWSPNTGTIKNELPSAKMLSNNVRYAEKSPSIASWVVAPGYAEKNEEKLAKFTRGLLKGANYRAENADEVAKWVAKEIAVDEQSVLDQTGDGEWITSDELVDMINDGSIKTYYEKQQDNFVEAERLTEDEKTDVDNYVLFDVMLDAADAIK